MANFIRFTTPNGDSIALTGAESINHVADKGVMITLPQYEKPRGWIGEKNNKRARLIRDLLIDASNGGGNDYTQIDWKAEFAELDKSSEPKKVQ